MAKKTASGMSVEVELKGSFAEALRSMDKRMTDQVLMDAAKAGATVVALSIAERIPVDKGKLKDNLGVTISSNSKKIEAEIGFLDSFEASIAYWVEHGHATREAKTALQKFFNQRRTTTGHVAAHPFFRPGVDASLADAAKAVIAVLDAAMAKREVQQSVGAGPETPPGTFVEGSAGSAVESEAA